MKSLKREQVLVWATRAAIYFFKQRLALLVTHLGLCHERLVPRAFIGGRLETRERRQVWGPRGYQVQAWGPYGCGGERASEQAWAVDVAKFLVK